MSAYQLILRALRAPILRVGRPRCYRRYGTAHRRLRARRMLRQWSPPAVSFIRSHLRRHRMIPLLKGLRILDLTSVILGPYATQILGDLGAEVDQGRAARGRQHAPGGAAWPRRALAPSSPTATATSARSRSTSRPRPARRRCMKLIPTADAFVHNMRQEAMDKLGFTFKAVRAANPKIVYAAAIGFGRHGRYAGKPAYDDVIQAASGFAGLFQMRDGAPALCADHRRRQGLGPAPGLRGAGRAALSRAHRRGARLRRGADVRADGGLQPVRAPERGHLRGGRQGRLRARHLAEPAALQDQGRLGRRAALYASATGPRC